MINTKTARFLIVPIIFTFSTKGQNKYPFSIYANGGYGITHFDANTPFNGMGNMGLKIHLGNGLSVFGGAAGQAFMKLSSYPKHPQVRKYYSELIGGEIGLMYAINLGNNWVLEPGIFYQQNTFSIRGNNTNFAFFSTKNYKKVHYLRPRMHVVGALVQARKKLTRAWDIQMGFQFFRYQVDYLDILQVPNTAKDMYTAFYLGLNYRLGTPTFKGPKSRSKGGNGAIGCPKF